MKASELIKQLQKIIDDTRASSFNKDVDPVIDVRIKINDELRDIEIIGTEGFSSFDYPEQTSPYTVWWATIQLKAV
jgi:hypothetical protein